MGLTIELLCNDGSPIGVIPSDIEGRGVGGAELCMMSLMQVLASRGHNVRVYNDPKVAGKHGDVEYLPLGHYSNRTPKDVVIVYRSPNKRFNQTQMPPDVKKLWWSTDQFTIGSFSQFSQVVDYVVTISPYHTEYHNRYYKIPLTKMSHIDLGVRCWEYADEIKKVPNRLIFCSIPDRGLTVLYDAWTQIKRDVPDATLTITSDYTLWGVGANNSDHRLQWARAKDVTFFGKVPRSRLVELQQKAEIMAYPSIYEELFCVSAAECQVAGALPVTSATGALPSTNEFGIVLPGSPRTPSWVKAFAGRIVSLLTDERKYLTERQQAMAINARRRFDWNRIAERWEKLFEKGTLN